MAIHIFSSMVSRISIPAPFSQKEKDLKFTSILCNSVNPLRLNNYASSSCRAASQPRLSRMVQVKATIFQEDEEKVVVEKSFDAKSFPDKEREGTSGESHDGSPPPSVLENWMIKLEQSVNIMLTESVIQILDTFYHDRDYARFYVLETIARVPYFAFISVLHMYESFGWWRRADYLKVHFAESWNEMHHLLIMEELGGNSCPRMAYHFSECVESHAFETYDKFIKTQGEELKTLPAPVVAVRYYTEGDLYMFDEFQTSRPPNSRRPKIENLYDVFVNIREDEAEHCKTMKTCQTHGNLRSPHSYTDDDDDDPGCILPQADCQGIVDCIRKSLRKPAANKN
ncbi:Ubiquinol oxidase 4, chloroplastic/chromoplastic [Orobanche hederae]